MDINTLLEHAAGVIRALPEMAAMPVIEVHKGNLFNKLQTAVAKTRFAVLVGWNGFRSRSNSSKTIVGDTDLVIEVWEKPVVALRGTEPANQDGGLRLLPTARLIANAVNLSQPPGQSPIVFREISSVMEPSPGVISCNVTFAVSNSTL